jgi:hypothetical protein
VGTGRAAELIGAATTLVDALLGDPARTPQRDPWRRSLLVESGFLVDLLAALGQINAALADRVVDCILAWTQTYEPDAVLTAWCTKNQASYERRAQQRQRDLAPLAQIEAPSG